MIKFFQKIRQNLVIRNKTGKPALPAGRYLKYAIGEIILVVIGILIAIQLNNLNEIRKENARELSFLVKLKDDINSDIVDITRSDSLVASREFDSGRALELFYKSTTVEDILTTDSLFKALWNNLILNRKTYDEMLNTSSIYILKNKKLRNQVTDYYTLIETFQQFTREMNSDSQQMRHDPNLDSHNFLVLEHDKPWFDIKKIDTTWIGDFNSPTSLALHKYYTHAQNNLNSGRRAMHKYILESSNILIDDIEQELKRKNYHE